MQYIPAQKVATLLDVAERASVSKMTVSKVLRNVGNISEKTRLKVREAARDLGYLPNSLAGSLSSRKSRLVAVIIPSMSDTVFSEVLSGVTSVLRTQGFQTFMGESHFDPEIEASLISAMLSFQPAGLLLNGGMVRNDEASRLLENRHCPAMQLWDCENSSLDFSAGPSHDEAGCLVANHFRSRSLSRIAYVGAELEKDLCARRRYLSLRASLAANGLELVSEISEAMPRQAASGRLLTEQLIAKYPDIQGIHYLNDAMALGGLAYLHEAGISVPQQISVIGFNGTSIPNTVRTKLTTVDVPRLAIGEAAAEALLNIIAGKEIEPSWRARISIVEGNTTIGIDDDVSACCDRNACS
ncbi:LacI family DNA-binding transcriptional regulator [Agrobacterium sp. rho-13.3]|uniref:LacI family DNA-binding transcriptional regulator n=1 Tax=Agrobacterium sp. rho-13.3 TaxID=3072980 RepID=UPI002A100CDC|nr:LacI family DNA-binding transcriptional regulator [Agrobacterium sp. rho-13.3]MDX8308181.1 LacI family DNA-binding transcriptional regulator [Agrobacterium sp. rho-13.3]